jgi:hypothetical protein
LEDQAKAKQGNYHDLIAIHSSPNAWILDLGTSHHMAAKKYVFMSLTISTVPPILLGDDTLVEVARQWRVELQHGIVENFLHVLKLSMNILSIYQIEKSRIGTMMEFTPDCVTIYGMHDDSNNVVGEVNHQSRLYTFSKFIAKSDSSFLLDRFDDDSIFRDEIFVNLNFMYMQQCNKKGMVKGMHLRSYMHILLHQTSKMMIPHILIRLHI